MTIINNTNVNLHINGGIITPTSKKEMYEGCFNTVNIHSDIGSIEIITEYNKRYIKNFGKITAKEAEEMDENGLPNIVIY